MAIRFERDKNGNVVAINDKGEQVGTVQGMGDNVKNETKASK